MSCSALQSTFPPRTTSHSSKTIFTVHLALFADHIHTTPRKPSPTPGAFGAQVSDNIRRDVINPYLLTWCIWRLTWLAYILLRLLSILPTMQALVPTSSRRSFILRLSTLHTPAILLTQLFSHTCSLC